MMDPAASLTDNMDIAANKYGSIAPIRVPPNTMGSVSEMEVRPVLCAKAARHNHKCHDKGNL